MTLTPTPFQVELQRCAREADLPVPAVSVTSRAADRVNIRYHRGRVVVTVTEQLLAAPVAVQELVAAHEMAHLHLGHLDHSGWRSRIETGLVALFGVVTILLASGVYWQPNSINAFQQWCGIALAVSLVGYRLFTARRSRRQEAATDLHAELVFGRAVTEEYVAWHRSTYSSSGWVPRFLYTHPSWEQRVGPHSR